MVHDLLRILNGMGIYGLLIVAAIEGTAIPFPSAMAIPYYGYRLNPNWGGLLAITLAVSAAYTAFSYIPFWIGFALHSKLPAPIFRKVAKAQKWLQKYGEWAIVLSRLVGTGSISYVAGMSKIKYWKYGLLTFLGNYPWSFLLLFLGRLYKGRTETISGLVKLYGRYFYLGLVVLLIGYASIKFLRRKKPVSI